MTRTPSILSLLLAPTVLFACGEAADVRDPDAGTDPDGGMPVADDCPSIFRQDILPTYELDIAPSEWAALDDEFHHRAEREAAGLDPKPYHPATFRYLNGTERVEIPDVRVRLKGNSSWAQTIAFDPNPKAQFVIAFNESGDSSGRFEGVRKIDLDMPRTDMTFLRHRLALKYLRGAGVPAQCANNARLVVNGQYYGLYTNLEHFDKELLQRVFGHDDANGDLWDGGRVIKTNEMTFTWDRLDALWAVHDLPAFDAIGDVDASMREWAAEMMVGDSDRDIGLRGKAADVRCGAEDDEPIRPASG